MNELVGRLVTAMFQDMPSDPETLRFCTDEGDMAFDTTSECCSRSWFSHIDGIDALLGHRVTSVEDRGVHEDKEDDTDYCVQVYGYMITTDAGRTLIEFRNASNGYYGGDCVRRDHMAVDCTVPLTEDF